jgi:hypothetical protein
MSGSYKKHLQNQVAADSTLHSVQIIEQQLKLVNIIKALQEQSRKEGSMSVQNILKACKDILSHVEALYYDYRVKANTFRRSFGTRTGPVVIVLTGIETDCMHRAYNPVKFVF